MRKNIFPLTLFVIGIASLLLSLINGVDNISLHTSYTPSSSSYRVETQGEIKCYGLFSIKTAEINLKIKNKNGIVLKEERIQIMDTSSFSMEKEYDLSDFYGAPYEMIAEVDAIQFNNLPFLIISSVIIGGAIVCFIVMKFRKKPAMHHYE